MKKFLFGSLALATLALTSCSEENEGLLNNTLEVFTGEIVSTDSRTSLGSDNSVLWSDGDAINLFKKTGYYQKYKVKEGGNATASFVYDNEWTKGNTLDMHYAVYPYAAGNTISGSTISVDLSSLANQTYTANSFEEEKAVMVAKSTTTNLPFTNALAVIRVNLNIAGPVNEATVSSIKIASAANALTGNATIDMSQDKPQAVIAADGGKEITLTAGNVALSQEMTPFYIMFPAGIYAENDLTVVVNAVLNGESKECAFILPAVTMERSKITTLEKTFDDDEEWTGSTEGAVEQNVATEDALQYVAEAGGSAILIADITTDEPLTVAEDLTIDLNGNNLNVGDLGFEVAEGKNLTIIDSKAGATMSARSASVGTTITATGDIIKASANSVITIGQGVNLVTTGANSCCVWIPAGAENVTLNTAGNLTATASGAAVISHNGNLTTGTINITGGNVTHEKDVAVYIAGNANLNISGGVIEGTTAVEIRAGQLNITGGELIATADAFSATANGNGSTSTGAALAVTQHNTNKDLNVVISGGTFTGVKAIYEEDTCDDNVSGISMSVTGGTFNGEIFSENCKNFIKGGTFSDASAFGYLADGASIKLGADMNIAECVVMNSTATINFNNHTITAGLKSEGRHHYAIDNFGTLVLEGNGAINARGIENFGTMTINGDITITNIDTNGGSAIWNEGALTINNGTFTTNNTAGEGSYGSALNTQKDGVAIVNGGTFIANSQLTYAILNEGGTTTINNATVKGKHGAVGNTSGSITINGGSFELMENPGISDHCAYKVTAIKGGQFTLGNNTDSGAQLFYESEIASGYKTIVENGWTKVVNE